MPERVVVVIPAFNEAAVIRGVVEGVRAAGYEVLVVDDGSADPGAQHATAFEAYMGGEDVLRCNENHGVGAVLATGILAAEADIIVTFDADGQHSPADIPALVAALATCDLANGSRFLGSHEGMPLHRRVVLWAVYVALWLLSGVEVTDPCCGLKAFRPAAFRIRSHRFAWAAELCYRVSRWGHIREVPVTVRYTEYSRRKGQRSSNVFRAGVELLRAVKGDSHVR
jgi:glycosyltransferase involved in cell wall biosynthesis